MSNQQTIADWIRECAADVQEAGPLMSLRCLHMLGNGGDREVHGMHVPQNGKPWRPEDVARIFEKRMAGYGQGLAGVQVYEMQAFYGASQDPKNVIHVDKAGVLSYGGDGITEEPSERGLTKQGMRLTEGIAQRAFGMVGMLFQEMRADRQELARDLRDARADARDSWVIIQDLLKKQIEGDHNRAMDQLRYQRESYERQKLMTLIPIVMNRIFGASVVPDSLADDSFFEVAAMHFDTMSPEEKSAKLAQLSQALPPEAVGLVMSRLMSAGQTAAVKTEAKRLLKEGERADREREESSLLDGVPELSDGKKTVQ